MEQDSDQEAPFRQRRCFFYMTGCNEPDCYAVYSIANDMLTLFINPVEDEHVIWSGLPMSPEEAKER